eukprot:m.108921 g.108921  ORF g.108921 m.108921 type:complete len:210 (+) comp12829_c0_seq2:167-796(+)
MEPPPVPPRSSRAPPSALTSVISDELVLGPFLSGSSVAELKTRGITHIVSVDEHYITKIDTVAPVHMTQIGIEDTVPPEDHVERKLEAVVKAIEDFLLQDGPKTKVYLHCGEGVGRSAAAAVLFVASSYCKQGHSFNTRRALARVQRARPIACPNPGYIEALLRAESVANGEKATPSISLEQYKRYYSDLDSRVPFEDWYQQHATTESA